MTGKVRSIRRRDEHYTKHLPHHGSPYAAIRIESADEDGGTRPAHQVTIDGAGVEGAHALGPRRAQFYSERSYLDQESLGRLLDLYQHTEDIWESALVRFANELLGLDRLNALRSGLHDATDIRRVRKLSNSYSDAETEAAEAAKRLTIARGELADAETELAESREDRRIDDLADEGAKLQTMNRQRTELEEQMQTAQREVSDLETAILT